MESTHGWSRIMLPKKFQELKQQSGPDLAIFGSANLMSELTRMDLIDEHRVLVNPVILGVGTPLFQTKEKLKLKLLKTRTFANGNVLLTYQSDDR